MFEAFYTMIDKGTGRKITDFFNEQLNSARQNKEQMIFLQKSLKLHKNVTMCYEKRDMFNTFYSLVSEELQKM